jgi:hypothetical protein
MTVCHRSGQKENELSLFGKVGLVALIALGFVAAVANIAKRVVVNPRAFWIALAGLVFFLIGKASVIAQGKWISFGPGLMSENVANLYRLGYWLMAVGILVTFV